MAESALEKLMRLAKEKKAASAAPVVATQPILIAASAEGGASDPVTESQESVGLEETKIAILSMQLGMVAKQVKEELANERITGQEAGTGKEGAESGTNYPESNDSTSGAGCGVAEDKSPELQVSGETAVAVNESPKALAEPVATSDHPLAMQFAELEQALLAQQPEFKTILRQIHRHLGQEPELVTQMTEQEIQLIVSGLVVFANAEIVAPAAEKSAKAKIAAAKKQPISADDL